MKPNLDLLDESSQKEIQGMFANKKTAWMAFSNSYDGIQNSKSYRSAIKKWYSRFEVVEIKMPLRAPRKVMESLKVA